MLKLLISLCLISTFVFTVHAYKKVDFHICQRITLKSEGLYFDIYDSFKSLPLQLPERKFAVNSEKKFYSTKEIWRYNQYVGRWGDSEGTCSIIKISIPFNDLLPEHVEEDNASIFNDRDSESVKWSENEVINWIENFTNKRVSSKPKVIKKDKTLQIMYYPLDIKTNYFVLTIQIRGFSQLLCFIYDFNDDYERNEIQKCIFDSITSLTLYEKKKTKKVEDDAESKSELQKSKELALQSIKNMKDWHYVEKTDFIILTNYPSTNTFYLDNLESELDNSIKLYKLFYPSENKINEVPIVRVFNNHKDYVKYIGEGYAHSTGIWVASQKELVIAPQVSETKKEEAEKLFDTLRHEGFHQYIFYALGNETPSMWFNEGNAAFFEGVEFNNYKNPIKIVEVEKYKKTIDAILAAKNQIDFEQFINLSSEQYYSKDEIFYNSKNNYAIGWALIYFLQKGAPLFKQYKGRDYTKIIGEYYNVFLETNSPKEANNAAWKNVDFKQFYIDFVTFYTDKKLRNKAEKYDILKDKLHSQ